MVRIRRPHTPSITELLKTGHYLYRNPFRMKKLISLFVPFFFFITASLAQGVISGQVLDAETGQPLEGASVFAQNTSHGTITNKEGNYRLPLGKGGYELVVSYTGYN